MKTIIYNADIANEGRLTRGYIVIDDEIIAEAPKGSRWEDMAEIMGQPIDWAPGLLLRADGYDTTFYMKD